MPQLSLVLAGLPNATQLAVHWPASVPTVTSAGQLIDGAWLSTTMTSNEHAAASQLLEAVQVTVFVPAGNACGEVITVAPSLHSTAGVGMPVAPVANVTKAEHWFGPVFETIVLGQVMTGAVLTVNVATAEGVGAQTVENTAR